MKMLCNQYRCLYWCLFAACVVTTCLSLLVPLSVPRANLAKRSLHLQRNSPFSAGMPRQATKLSEDDEDECDQVSFLSRLKRGTVPFFPTDALFGNAEPAQAAAFFSKNAPKAPVIDPKAIAAASAAAAKSRSKWSWNPKWNAAQKKNVANAIQTGVKKTATKNAKKALKRAATAVDLKPQVSAAQLMQQAERRMIVTKVGLTAAGLYLFWKFGVKEFFRRREKQQTKRWIDALKDVDYYQVRDLDAEPLHLDTTSTPPETFLFAPDMQSLVLRTGGADTISGLLRALWAQFTTQATRPASLRVALNTPFRALLAEFLVETAPLGTFPDSDINTVSNALTATGISALTELTGEVLMKELLTAARDEWTLSPFPAESFAQVVNPLLISLVDRAVRTLNNSPSRTVAALNTLFEFMRAAEALYARIIPAHMPILPVLYYGSATKSQVEELYRRYLASTSEEENSGDADERRKLNSKREGKRAAAAVDTAQWLYNLDRLQVVLRISSRRRRAVFQSLWQGSMEVTEKTEWSELSDQNSDDDGIDPRSGDKESAALNRAEEEVAQLADAHSQDPAPTEEEAALLSEIAPRFSHHRSDEVVREADLARLEEEVAVEVVEDGDIGGGSISSGGTGSSSNGGTSRGSSSVGESEFLYIDSVAGVVPIHTAHNAHTTHTTHTTHTINDMHTTYDTRDTDTITDTTTDTDTTTAVEDGAFAFDESDEDLAASEEIFGHITPDPDQDLSDAPPESIFGEGYIDGSGDSSGNGTSDGGDNIVYYEPVEEEIVSMPSVDEMEVAPEECSRRSTGSTTDITSDTTNIDIDTASDITTHTAIPSSTELLSERITPQETSMHTVVTKPTELELPPTSHTTLPTVLPTTLPIHDATFSTTKTTSTTSTEDSHNEKIVHVDASDAATVAASIDDMTDSTNTNISTNISADTIVDVTASDSSDNISTTSTVGSDDANIPIAVPDAARVAASLDDIVVDVDGATDVITEGSVDTTAVSDAEAEVLLLVPDVMSEQVIDNNSAQVEIPLVVPDTTTVTAASDDDVVVTDCTSTDSDDASVDTDTSSISGTSSADVITDSGAGDVGTIVASADTEVVVLIPDVVSEAAADITTTSDRSVHEAASFDTTTSDENTTTTNSDNTTNTTNTINTTNTDTSDISILPIAPLPPLYEPRPADLSLALSDSSFRALYASSSLRLLPMGAFSTEVSKVVHTAVAASESPKFKGLGDHAVKQMVQSLDKDGLNSTYGAVSMAAVTSALLVDLVDSAVHTLQQKNHTVTVLALDTVVEFVGKSEQLSREVVPEVVPVAPIVYTGDAVQAKLDELFYRYLKHVMRSDISTTGGSTSGYSGGNSCDVSASTHTASLLENFFSTGIIPTFGNLIGDASVDDTKDTSTETTTETTDTDTDTDTDITVDIVDTTPTTPTTTADTESASHLAMNALQTLLRITPAKVQSVLNRVNNELRMKKQSAEAAAAKIATHSGKSSNGSGSSGKGTSVSVSSATSGKGSGKDDKWGAGKGFGAPASSTSGSSGSNAGAGTSDTQDDAMEMDFAGLTTAQAKQLGNIDSRSLAQLNDALDSGAKKSEILLLEKQFGFASDKIVRVLQDAGPARLRELEKKAGGNFAGMVALFKKMAAIKAKG